MQLPDDIRILYMDRTAPPVDAWEGVLSQEEYRRRALISHERRRDAFTLGRIVARTLAGEALGLAPHEVPIQVASDGALDLVGVPQRISIAHAGDRAVAALSGGRPVGVDLERIRPRHPALDRYLLHPDEHGNLEATDLDRDAALILYWTLKEATLKAMRTGLRVSPRTLYLNIDVPASRAVVTSEEGAAWEAAFSEMDGYFMSVVYRRFPG